MSDTAAASADEAEEAEISASLTRYLHERLKVEVAPDDDLFAAGLANSMFAMELVVHLEQTFGVMVEGQDLKLDNFRSARSMAGLVTRLRA
ncbi:acyl carrier protein [Streptomyces acidiscabies]|uniref:Methoxymalonate biosynthesis protein n=1 Tax=Streptomyces acidiscabies TaxID=42234 RepID=A0A0L0JI44_9ACTN|nr:acyl carrier protein [Streptomyces acidiscabies]KND25283.1 methoxymalonate biosynthesis protein [Streptomyces acidiscabies]